MSRGVQFGNVERIHMWSHFYLVEGEVPQPENGTEDTEDALHHVWTDLDDLEGKAEGVELLGVVHPVKLDASGVVQVGVLVGGLNLKYVWYSYCTSRYFYYFFTQVLDVLLNLLKFMLIFTLPESDHLLVGHLLVAFFSDIFL